MAARKARRAEFEMPLPEDRSAIQFAIGEVLQRIAANQLDPRRAGLLLYGLQIASLNLPRPQPAASRTEAEAALETVEEIVVDPELGTLAPRADITAPPRHKSSIRLLLEKFEREDKEKEREKNAVGTACLRSKLQPGSPSLDDIQAVAVPTPATPLRYSVSEPSDSAGPEAACPSSNLSSASRSPHRRSAPSASAPSPASPSSASTPSAPPPTARRPRSRCSSRWAWRASRYIVPISAAIIGLLTIVYFSYRQTIDAYPHGGGSYTVASENLGDVAGLFAAAALMIDYILNSAVGISAGVGALVSAFPALQPHTLALCLLILAVLTLVNMRGTKDAGTAFLVPTYLFIGRCSSPSASASFAPSQRTGIRSR